ncbi:membrane protein with transport function [Oenococcus alcoholitolerans]|uniref:Membrane protein with transport function n=1 Tax=Oenococcus alcoholitolerans TaxID=931074 RepID=A0ABR4XR29_9LACO|nr:membrane protein with transport function [Oenococcus alcoholitolerans]
MFLLVLCLIEPGAVFGKRTPWYLSGALLAAISFYLIGSPRTGIGVLLAYCFANIGQNMMTAPIVATLSDRVPHSNRGTVSAAYGGGITVGQAVGTFLGSLFIFQTGVGFFSAALMYIFAGLFAFILLPKEPRSDIKYEKEKLESVWKVIIKAFTPPFHAPDFWRAFICRTSLIVAYQMISAYQLYIIEDHLGQSRGNAGTIISIMSVITMIVSFAASITSGPFSDKIGRRKPVVISACALYALGIAMPWLIPSATGMFLFAGIAGLGYGIFMSVDQALNVDVLPNKDNAGKDLGFLNVASCAGQAIGSGITSSLVTFTSSYTPVFPVAIVITAIAAFSIVGIKGVK